MLKYLYGKLPVTSTLNQGSKEKIGRASALLFSVCCDEFQHHDMASNFGYFAQAGGFAALQQKTPDEMFFGKSVSCNVTTSKELNPTLMELVKNGNIFHCSTHKVKDVWLFLEKDYTPEPDEGVEFKQVTMEEFKARTDELINDSYYL